MVYHVRFLSKIIERGPLALCLHPTNRFFDTDIYWSDSDIHNENQDHHYSDIAHAHSNLLSSQ